jgi:hypothetical protein
MLIKYKQLKDVLMFLKYKIISLYNSLAIEFVEGEASRWSNTGKCKYAQ